jgi:aryl-alcohol dehydrogenase-like predicted oxidoreductase
MAQFALRWILMWDAVSCVIPGARTASQARENTAAAGLPAIAPRTMEALRGIYDAHLRPLVHQSW